MCLRGTNFSCSLIVLALLTTTFAIFNATKALAPRSGLSAWAPGQKTWPQILLLTIACVSLAFCLGIFYAYWKGGHRRAEKATVYYTFFSIAFFMFSIIMWAIGAAVLNQSRNNGEGKDMWGWSCKDGKRKDVFAKDVDYALICRLQVGHIPLSSLLSALTQNLALVAHLCIHRNHRRNHHYQYLRHRLLPLLFQAETH